MMHAFPTDHFLDIPSVRSHVVDWGGPADAPAILFIHGLNLTANARVWSLAAPTLAQKFRVMALDLRGHGLTPSPSDDDFSFEALCGDMQSVCDQLGLGRPIVVGHSWGGDVALQYAARQVDGAAGAVILDGGFVGINRVMTWPQAEQMATPLRTCTRLAEVQDLAKYWLREFYSAEVFELIMGGFEVRADDTVSPRLAHHNQLTIARAQWQQNPDTLYAQVKCPALFLPCLPPEGHDPMPKQYLAWKQNRMALVQTVMTNARIKWLEDSIHDVHLQRPELVAACIGDFAQEIFSTR